MPFEPRAKEQLWRLAQYNGARVRVGQYAARGTVLALTGSTGLASKPHLHFDVSVPIDGNKGQSFPIKFETATGVQDLVQGLTYTANWCERSELSGRAELTCPRPSHR